MPTLKPLVITDGTTARTLNPVKSANGVSDYRTVNAATRAAQMKAHFEMRDTSAGQRCYVRLTQPVTATSVDTGLTTVVDNMIAEVSLRIPDVASAADRDRFVKQAFNLGVPAALGVELTTGEGQW